jgi:3-oxoacyl-[acyl-carrier-protein] synthase II
MNRVVITGLGVISPVGNNRKQFWANLVEGQSGIGPITLFDATSFPIRIGGEVKKFNIEHIKKEFPDTENIRDRKVFLALGAAEESILDAGLNVSDLDEALLFTGTGLEMFCLEDLTPYAHLMNVGNAITGSLVSNMNGHMLQNPLDTTSNILGDKYGFNSGKYINCSACAAGAQVIGQAFEILRDGQEKLALAGAFDSMLNPLGLGGFSLLKILSDENEEPEKACRPFDLTRKGTVLGEGAAFIVMETLGNALKRKADIYAEVIGYGSSMDAFRVSDPDTEASGAILSMTKALANAKIKQNDIDCVSAHGTGTIKNDIMETVAIKEVLGKHAYDISIHSVKSMTGHMIAASGAVEAVAAVLTIHEKKIPPTINLTKADEQCDLDYVPNRFREFHGETVLSNSFGFGGQNATLIFRRFTDGL